MKKTNKIVLTFLSIPIIIFLLLVAKSDHTLKTGKEVTLPITGYDPRDL